MLLQALLVVVGVWLILKYAFPPLLPKTLMIQFMTISIIGVLLYFSFDDERWDEFKAPILAVLCKRKLWPARWVFMLAIPVLVAYIVYDAVKPGFDAPVELRQVHPAPPSKLQVFNKSYNLGTLENPVRAEILKMLGENKDAAMAKYNEAVAAGSQTYFENCFFCHGDLLDGDGPYASGFNPLPINFQDVGTIAQLQEGFLFWRITTGGPGLPREGTPWNSAMPVWHEMLNEEEVWNLITFLYDYVGQVPRMWDQETSRAVSGMKEEIKSRRAGLSGQDLYRFRCAACHGEQGAGDGSAAERMYPKPRDFTYGLYKYKTSPGSLPPRDEDLFNTIKNGLEETGMPAWKSLLTDAQINSLIPVLKGFDITSTWAPEEADEDAFDDEGRYTKTDFIKITEKEPEEDAVLYTPESVARGKEVFLKACKECHGNEGRGNITSGKKLADDWGFRIWPRDLSKPWTWRATNVSVQAETARDETIRNIYSRLSIGIPGTPMPAHRAVEEGNKDPIELEDRWHVSNYVYSLRENAAPEPGGDTVLTGVKVAADLPDNPDDEVWQHAPQVSLRMVPNIIKEDRLFTPLNNAVSVRVLYNEQEIAFLLEINDRTDSRPGEPVSVGIQDEELTMYADAIAVQFPKDDAYTTAPMVEKPLYRHGDAAHHTTIWYWSAGSMEPEAASRVALLDGSGPDKPLAARKDDNSLAASGQWQDGRWRIIMKRPRQGGGGDLNFAEDRYIPISFANWDGSNGEIGSKHTLTTWYWLLLPPEMDVVKVYGLPLGIGLLTFLAGLLLVRAQRRYD